ncbi:MAG TPA: sigma-70 family RNA polymerase sigma factor [Caulobacteraceae bacterium]|nr:sigma-70 family RNA polymerase sigma factor [Caulobacteraceae bacterium]
MTKAEDQEARYRDAIAQYGPAIERLARAYEADADERRDLVQDIHVALWRSFEGFDGRCSLGTWTWRVAHNAAASHVGRRRRTPHRLATLEQLESAPAGDDPEAAAGERQVLDRLSRMIQALGPPDQQVMLLYLEDLPAAEIAEITGLSPGAVAVKIHRLKALLARRFQQGGSR